MYIMYVARDLMWKLYVVPLTEGWDVRNGYDESII